MTSRIAGCDAHLNEAGPGPIHLGTLTLAGLLLLALLGCPGAVRAPGEQICAPGQKACEDGVLLSCSADGTQIEHRTDCAPGICRNAACVTLDGGTSDASAGDGWVPCGQSSCSGFTYCDDVSDECLPGCAGDGQCQAHERCEQQSHSCVCQTGFHRCGQACVSDGEPATCGSSCTPCPGLLNGHATCDLGACGLACDANFHFCGEVCASNSDLATCGQRCEVCPDDAHGVAICQDQSCAATCHIGYHWCTGGCALDRDVASCGQRCEPCPDDANGVASCTDGQCGLACNAGYLACGQGCAPCPDIANSIGACAASSCVFAGCVTGYRVCGQACCPFTVTQVAAASLMGDSDVAVDGAGTAHLVWHTYPSGGLHYQAGLTGTPEDIEPGDGEGQYLALALDSSERPVVAYYHEVDKQLKFATRESTGWTVEVVDADGDVGSYVSLDLDSGGQPHIAYYDSDGKNLKYAAHSAQGWSVQFVDLATDVGIYAALRLDAADHAHIAYWDQNRSVLRYARWTGTTWLFEDVDSGLYTAPLIDLALDPAGNPHISYVKPSTLRHAAFNGTSWQFEELFPGVVTSKTSIEIDAGGLIHVLYVNRGDAQQTYDLNYLLLSGGRWYRTIVAEDLGFLGGRHSLSLDATGNPHITYMDYNASPDSIHYAH